MKRKNDVPHKEIRAKFVNFFEGNEEKVIEAIKILVRVLTKGGVLPWDIEGPLHRRGL